MFRLWPFFLETQADILLSPWPHSWLWEVPCQSIPRLAGCSCFRQWHTVLQLPVHLSRLHRAASCPRHRRAQAFHLESSDRMQAPHPCLAKECPCAYTWKVDFTSEPSCVVANAETQTPLIQPTSDGSRWKTWWPRPGTQFSPKEPQPPQHERRQNAGYCGEPSGMTSPVLGYCHRSSATRGAARRDDQLIFNFTTSKVNHAGRGQTYGPLDSTIQCFLSLWASLFQFSCLHFIFLVILKIF